MYLIYLGSPRIRKILLIKFNVAFFFFFWHWVTFGMSKVLQRDVYIDKLVSRGRKQVVHTYKQALHSWDMVLLTRAQRACGPYISQVFPHEKKDGICTWTKEILTLGMCMRWESVVELIRYNQFWLPVGSCALVVHACRDDHYVAGQNSPLSRPDHKNKAYKHYMTRTDKRGHLNSLISEF